MRGAGMQALNFGMSKARVIDPNDQSQKVTFKDVAGAKEAKQELEEDSGLLEESEKVFGYRCRNSERRTLDGSGRNR